LEHLFIINPKSFPKKSQMNFFMADVARYFKTKTGGTGYTIHISRFPRDAIIVIRKRLLNTDRETVLRVYAVGGDGIMFDCLNGIIGMPNTELALMPYGTGSDFVLAFGKRHYRHFCNIDLQVSAPTIPTDVIRCGSNYALNFCAVGMEAATIFRTIALNEQFERIRRRFHPLNSLLYIIGGLTVAFDKRLRGQYYEITADGEDMGGEYNAINIANGPYYGVGKSPIRSALPDDGLLNILIYKNNGPLRPLSMLNEYLHGGWGKFPGSFLYRNVKKMSVRSPMPIMVNLDGETFFDTNLDIEIIPQAVKIAAVLNLKYQSARSQE
jgi:diacylglycerol kinase family enzyme